MKKLFLLAIISTFSFQLRAQEADPKDVSSPDAILAALYDVISGPAGEQRDWDRMKSLFIAEGRLMPSFKNPQTGEVGYRDWTVQEYIDQAGASLEKNGFFEIEIARRAEQYGTIMHAFSTYESRRKADDKEPFARGINSIQLLNGGDRWYIVSVFWMGENAEFPLPQKYLEDN
ncbi:hypothetical protein BXY85_0378 [Roseivirga pacifica]|uniref:DUF4440 domain-containing protein n=1 Tax=Roseivirga pacifica TaxID=1267423 RepID=A0A1I0RCR4_9BACT|nr:hypothetical protein [Roseivirga pacifica]RKQ49389.1 hypothetical protein BXY85_0378 [Roseivirga pacifica]SEW38518.1 hypothetical protein SAMN05216290_3431 [Roseivirga pacifica]